MYLSEQTVLCGLINALRLGVNMQDVIRQLAIELYFIHNCTPSGKGLSYSRCLEFAREQVEYQSYNNVA